MTITCGPALIGLPLPPGPHHSRVSIAAGGDRVPRRENCYPTRCLRLRGVPASQRGVRGFDASRVQWIRRGHLALMLPALVEHFHALQGLIKMLKPFVPLRDGEREETRVGPRWSPQIRPNEVTAKPANGERVRTTVVIAQIGLERPGHLVMVSGLRPEPPRRSWSASF
jgi:hypothetical protein